MVDVTGAPIYSISGNQVPDLVLHSWSFGKSTPLSGMILYLPGTDLTYKGKIKIVSFFGNHRRNTHVR